MSTSLKLISCNIEGDNHYEKLEKFFAEQQADVYCLQEVFEVDLPILEKITGGKAFFAGYGKISQPNTVRLNPKGTWGVAIFTKLPTQFKHATYYVGDENIPEYVDGNPNCFHRAVVSVDVKVGEHLFHVLTTHFTWTPEGSVTNEQLRDLEALFLVLQKEKPFILAGDFNAPRGKTTFDTLAHHFTDNIPKEYTTSMDPDLHRVKNLQYMVDGLFTTSPYQAKNVKLISRVSDHQAIVAEILI